MLGKTTERRGGRIADVETRSIDRVRAFPPPTRVPSHLILQIPPNTGHTVGQGQRHACIVRPLAGIQSVWASGSVTGHELKTPRPPELDGRSQRITDGQAQQCSTFSFVDVHRSSPVGNVPHSPATQRP